MLQSNSLTRNNKHNIPLLGQSLSFQNHTILGCILTAESAGLLPTISYVVLVFDQGLLQLHPRKPFFPD